MIALIIILCVVVLALCFTMGIVVRFEAISQEKNDRLWFVLGFFFGINAFIGLKLGKYALKKKHDGKLWAALGVIFGVFSIVAFMTAINAEDRGSDFSCWSLIGFAFCWIGFFASLFLKPSAAIQTKNTEEENK